MALSKHRDIIIAAIVAAVVEYFIGTFLRIFWLSPLIDGHTFHSTFVWFDPLQFVYWSFAFCLSFLVAAALTFFFAATWLRVGLTSGVVCGLVHFLNSRNIFAPAATPIIIAWVYGQYPVPLAGGIAGAGIVHSIQRHEHRSAI